MHQVLLLFFGKLCTYIPTAAVRRGHCSATAIVQASLARIAATDGRVNAFTDVTASRALERAAALDARLARRDAATMASNNLLNLSMSSITSSSPDARANHASKDETFRFLFTSDFERIEWIEQVNGAKYARK